MSGFSYLYLGLSSLRSFRQAMNNAGNNIANVATPGFARRRVEFQGLPDQLIGKFNQGLGVEVSTVRRLTDPFLDFAARREMSRLGGDGQRAQLLSQLEPLLGPVDGAPLQNALSEFFGAFEALAVPGNESVSRQEAVKTAESLAATIRRLDAGLIGQRVSANRRVEDMVGRVNEILEGLAEINRQIPALEAGGAEAGELRDGRDRLLDELAALVPVRAIENEQGQISVFIEGTGDTLLDHGTVYELTLSRDVEGMNRVMASRAGKPADISDLLRAGELGGVLAVRDESIPAYRVQLGELAAALIQEVNALHSSGFDAAGNPGLALFEPDPPGAGAAGSIRVNAAIVADPELVVAADAAGEAGNKEIARAIAALREQSLAGLGDRDLVEFAADVIAGVGRDTATADVQREASAAIVQSFEAKRKAVSGVSLDEEAANLAAWQQAFQASARFMETVNRMTEIAFNLLSR